MQLPAKSFYAKHGLIMIWAPIINNNAIRRQHIRTTAVLRVDCKVTNAFLGRARSAKHRVRHRDAMLGVLWLGRLNTPCNVLITFLRIFLVSLLQGPCYLKGFWG